jgi:uncharacterized protein (TIGR00730 family)
MINIFQRSSKQQRRAKKKHLDKRLQMLLRRAKMIEDELLKLQADESFYRVCIFGSARIKPDSPQYIEVAALAEKLSRRGIDILTGGGPGLMEAANLGARRAHVIPNNDHTGPLDAVSGEMNGLKAGMSYGISIELPFEPTPNHHLDIKRHHQKFSSRLDDFVRLSHSIIVTPGGIGTLLELFFCWQLVQVKHVPPRPILLLERDYWEGIVDWLRKVTLERELISANDFDSIIIVDSVDETCNTIFNHHDEFLKSFK